MYMQCAHVLKNNIRHLLRLSRPFFCFQQDNKLVAHVSITTYILNFPDGNCNKYVGMYIVPQILNNLGM